MVVMWTISDSRRLAEEHISGMGHRWDHLSQVGRTAEDLAERSPLVTQDVVCAAWVHDLGYAPGIVVSGLHPLDGARFLSLLGVPREIVSLVAFHTGALYEAEERGLADQLAAFPQPVVEELDLLTMIDLAIAPDGSPILDTHRIKEILSRYEDGHPVNRAIRRSEADLLASSARGKHALGLADGWPVRSA
jgi:HD domain